MKEQDLEQTIEAELARALDAGWSTKRVDRTHVRLAWELEPPQAWWPHSSGHASYDLEVTNDHSTILLLYGNTDAGAFHAGKLLRRAIAISTDGLRLFPLSKLLREIFENREKLPPNLWGLT